MKGKVLVVHGGGPTPVINCSLYGVIKEAKKHKDIDSVYGAIFGTQGFLQERFVRLDTLDEEKLSLLLNTPGTAIGTSRWPIYEAEYEHMVQIAESHGFDKIIFNGGNGTMDTCGRLYEFARGKFQIIGIPKTVDNDLTAIDHSPGYGSAARYMAGTVGEITQDIKGMPIHVSIIESMGRNTGWIAASSALGKSKGYAPDLIYLPEKIFDEEMFLYDVEKISRGKGGVVVVASEGLKKADGQPIAKPIFKTDRATYFGDVGTHLAQLVISRLGIKARSEKPGIAGRASVKWISEMDRDEAIVLGEHSVRLLSQGTSGEMVGIKRVNSKNYLTELFSVPIQQVMMTEKHMPSEYINEKGNNVTDKFIEYAKPLIGGDLPEYANFIRY